jgi:hypothetical protein
MDLLDRYLQAVKFWLPKAQQDDIVAELSADIHSQIEEQETELGRRLNEAEMEAILKKRPAPLLMATRYLPQRYLIGPVLFPVYLFVLKIVTLCYLVPWILVWVALISFNPRYRAAHSVSGDLFGGWGSFWLTAFFMIGIVTTVFAVLERKQSWSSSLEHWEPRKLPPVRNPMHIPRSDSVVELAANLVFIVWCVDRMWSRTVFDFSGVRIVLAPGWQVFVWAFLMLALLQVVLSAANLLHPHWTPLRSGSRLVLDVAGSAAFCWLLKAHLLAGISAPDLSPEKAAAVVNAINTYMARSFPIAVVACVMIVGLADVGRIVRLGRASRARLIQTLA